MTVYVQYIYAGFAVFSMMTEGRIGMLYTQKLTITGEIL
jgi:hypothetical protein